MVKTLCVTVAFILGIGHVANAQLRGLGFVQGKIVDDKGAPLPDVTFSATLPGAEGQLTAHSNERGEWKIVGMARGEWNITFEKAGYAKGRAKVILEVELSRIPPVTIKMKSAM